MTRLLSCLAALIGLVILLEEGLFAGTVGRQLFISEGTSLPSTCSEGRFHHETDAGGTEIYVCTATDTWTKFASTPELDAHLNDTADAHAASAVTFTPAGTITSATVQAAIEEVSTEANAITSQETFDRGSGRVGPVDIIKPIAFYGDTLEYRIYEQGGAGVNGWFDSTSGLPIPFASNCPAGGTCGIFGDGIAIVEYHADSASQTISGSSNYCLDAVGTDAYACSMVPPLDRYVTGGLYSFKAGAANTTAATINFNALGVRTIKKVVGGITTDLATNDIRLGQVVVVQYDGTNMQIQSTLGNAATGGGGNPAPIRPYSAVPVTAGKVFGFVHNTGAGTGARMTEGMGVMASLDANADWDLRFQLPPTLDTGCTYRLRLKAQANAATGNAQVQPTWASVAAEEDPSAITHTSEGTTQVAWGSGDAHQFKITDITLDADTLVGGEEVSMILRFLTSGWTLAQVSTWNAFIVCTP